MLVVSVVHVSFFSAESAPQNSASRTTSGRCCWCRRSSLRSVDISEQSENIRSFPGDFPACADARAQCRRYLTPRGIDYCHGQQARVGLAGRRVAQGVRQCGICCIRELANCASCIRIRIINSSSDIVPPK